jgi:hypothetical protein
VLQPSYIHRKPITSITAVLLFFCADSPAHLWCNPLFPPCRLCLDCMQHSHIGEVAWTARRVSAIVSFLHLYCSLVFCSLHNAEAVSTQLKCFMSLVNNYRMKRRITCVMFRPRNIHYMLSEMLTNLMYRASPKCLMSISHLKGMFCSYVEAGKGEQSSSLASSR